jgi:hypothetical protein
MALTNFATRRVKDLLGQVGYGGPALTNVAFRARVDALRDAMSDNQTAYLDYDCQARCKTFAKKHGAALETRILCFTGQPNVGVRAKANRMKIVFEFGTEA